MSENKHESAVIMMREKKYGIFQLPILLLHLLIKEILKKHKVIGLH